MSEASQSEVTVAPPEGETKEPKLIRFVVDENAFQPEVYQQLNKAANIINRLSELTYFLNKWGDKVKISETQKADKTAREVAIILERLVVSLDKQPQGKQYDELEEQDIKTLADKYEINLTSANITMIKVSSFEEAEEVESRTSVARSIIHDLRTPLTKVMGYIGLATKMEITDEIMAGIKRGLVNTTHNSNSCLELLENPYAKETVDIHHFIEQLTEMMRGPKIKVKKENLDIAKQPVVWSHAWMESLAYNLIQNMEKAYQTKPTSEPVGYIGSKIIQMEGKPFLLITIEDRGPGLHWGFTGFKAGQTHWDNADVQKISTGVGMDAQLQAIRRYGGDITISNVFNMKLEKIGARIRVLLPLPPSQAADTIKT